MTYKIRAVLTLFIVSFLMIAIPKHGYADHISKVQIDGLVCDFCAVALEKIFNAEEKVEKISLDLTSKILTLEYKSPEKLEDKKLHQLINDAGYSVRNIEHVSH